MEIPNISLAYQIAELKPIVEGSILRKVQELENGWLKLKLQTRQGTKDLIAGPDAMFLTGFSMPARQQTSGFGAFLRKRLSNKRVVSLEQHDLDRIVVMGFEESLLIFELFAKGNVILAGKGMEIISAFRKETWKDRTLKKGFPYRFPSSKGTSPASLDENLLKKAFGESSLDAVRTLVKQANIAPVFAEEACLKAGIGKETPAKMLSRKEISLLTGSAKQLYSISLEKEKPMLAIKEGKEILLPFPLAVPGARILENFPSVNEAIDSVYSRHFYSGESRPASQPGRKKPEFQQSMQRQRDAMQALQLKAEENALKAELIYENYGSLFEMQQELKKALIQKQTEKEIMYKLGRHFPFLKQVDPKNRKALVSLEKQAN